MALNGERHVLVVAGSDSSGGAGIARDIETIAAHGLRSCVAVAAVTVQTHDEVRRIASLPPEIVADQMRAAIASNDVAAIKIGMLAGGETIAAVACVLADHPTVPVVLDPVLAASSGASLLEAGGLDQLRELLFPRCMLLTPNLPELARLAGATGQAEGEEAAIRQAGRMLATGAAAVLVKGGHAAGHAAIDILVTRDAQPCRFAAPRLPVTMRGTGCMLSSAIAAGLAGGLDVAAAIGAAKGYLNTKLEAHVAS
ncbi:hydroxymethylpyrimidine/phosphomethylpyrimidine kinase [Rhizobiaceae bacterium n13]|uniref:hydroxymethylpyrimidine kinase n=1 Tax=Ferirhizobium litorale TaxID=2927786 RepID=A0AAE3QCK3_9HYPH|nr:hydroxymethylpyrimidine/phosphomethylpyrimidine kinase [Fererhizobium litorale]MDI7862083.1 hydroxymethylpyrimidine/phosphomethylpyrimidine kinase [Fererhizobium litorale]MDI7922645.1 hydroxymethylpyrimidine/phosphomethylpyrimidine kinase [Fererhizobium litorale]